MKPFFPLNPSSFIDHTLAALLTSMKRKDELFKQVVLGESVYKKNLAT